MKDVDVKSVNGTAAHTPEVVRGRRVFGYKSNETIYWQFLIMSHSLLWRHIVLLMVGVYSSNHRVLYTIGISMTRRFQKSVDPSVCQSGRL